MTDILEKVQASDVLVITTPTYFLTMNGMIKTTIDRFLPKWQELGGHEVYMIITGYDNRSGLKLVGDELTVGVNIYTIHQNTSPIHSGYMLTQKNEKTGLIIGKWIHHCTFLWVQ